MKTKCKNKLKEINAEVQALQKDLIAASRSYNYSSDEDQLRSSFQIVKTVMSNGHGSFSAGIAAGQIGDGEAFAGFSLEDPLRESCRSKSFQLSLKVLSNGHARDGSAQNGNGVVKAKGKRGTGILFHFDTHLLLH